MAGSVLNKQGSGLELAVVWLAIRLLGVLRLLLLLLRWLLAERRLAAKVLRRHRRLRGILVGRLIGRRLRAILGEGGLGGKVVCWLLGTKLAAGWLRVELQGCRLRAKLPRGRRRWVELAVRRRSIGLRDVGLPVLLERGVRADGLLLRLLLLLSSLLSKLALAKRAAALEGLQGEPGCGQEIGDGCGGGSRPAQRVDVLGSGAAGLSAAVAHWRWVVALYTGISLRSTMLAGT